MALQEVHLKREVLEAAVIDGINVYVREALIGQGILDPQALDSQGSPDLDEIKHAIARRIAASWAASLIEEEA